MGRVFLVDLGDRTHYRCRFCEIPLALIVDVLSRSFTCSQGKALLFNKGERDSWTLGREDYDLWYAYSGRCILLLLRTDYWMEYVTVHDKNQKYEEGKIVLERWRITLPELEEVLNLDSHSGSSDAETP